MLETLLQAIDKMGSFQYTGKGSLYGWISRIAINKALNQLKRHRWRMVPMDLSVHDNIPEPTEEEMVTIPREKLQTWIIRKSPGCWESARPGRPASWQRQENN